MQLREKRCQVTLVGRRVSRCCRHGQDERRLLVSIRKARDLLECRRALCVVAVQLGLVGNHHTERVLGAAVSRDQLLQMVRRHDQPAESTVAHRGDGIAPMRNGDLCGSIDEDEDVGFAALLGNRLGRHHCDQRLTQACIVCQQKPAFAGASGIDDGCSPRNLLGPRNFGCSNGTFTGAVIDVVLYPLLIREGECLEWSEFYGQLRTDPRVALPFLDELRTRRRRPKGNVEEPDSLTRAGSRHIRHRRA